MPEMDGLTLLERLITERPHLKIVLLTGHATVAKGVQAMKLGALDVLEKPIDIRVLTEKIKTLAQQDPPQQPKPAISLPPNSTKGILSKIFGSKTAKAK